MKMVLFTLIVNLALCRLVLADVSVMEIQVDEYLRFTKDVVQPKLQFASYYANNMVLQQAPKRATVWGYATHVDTTRLIYVHLLRQHNDAATLEIVSSNVADVEHSVATGQTIWSTKLKATKHGGPYSVRVTYESVEIAIENILFGDVWLCSGQSNMQFGVDQMFGASAEIEEAKKYPDIRLFNAFHVKSPTPLADLARVDIQWSPPNNESLTNGTWTHFSAVCWLYGKHLRKALGYPIGLVESCWGGTPIESWSSPKSLKRCGVKGSQEDILWDGVLYTWKHSELWNAMIHPLLNMTIHGAIWYQGEANYLAPDSYNCTFPSMIRDWRDQFHAGSRSETDPLFPFGFVQLGPYHKNGDTIVAGFSDIRWHQTCDMGYVPNRCLPRVFMAVGMDDTDPTSPYGTIHPRDKVLIGDRLSRSGLSVAYGHKGIHYQGPFPTHYVLSTDETSLDIIYDSGRANLTLKNSSGFEVCCCPIASPHCCNISGSTDWQLVKASFRPQQSARILLQWPGCGSNRKLAGMRYEWRETPCAYRHCAVYDADLPAPPYVIRTNFYSDRL